MTKTQITTIVDEALNNAMNDYIGYSQKKHRDLGIEGTFQFKLGTYLQIRLNGYDVPGEFDVNAEIKYNQNNHRNYIDLVVEYIENEETYCYFVELKFRNKARALDYGAIEAYSDICRTEQHVRNNDCVKGYFIFMTNEADYKVAAVRGARTDIPLYDGYQINPGVVYTTTTKSTQEKIIKKHHSDNFIFNNSYTLNYSDFNVDDEAYYYFLVNID